MKVVIDGGAVIEIGATEAAPTIGIIDYSRRETDDFGVTTVVPRGFARQMSVRVKVPTDNVDAIQRQLAALRATPAQWIADDRFDSLSIHGFYRDFSLDLAVPPVSYCTLTIEGLAEDGAFVDPGTDPAPDQRTSTLRLLQPATITDAVLISSTIPETDYPVWSNTATYALGARVIKTATHRIYESAAAGNVGNDPAGASGLWSDIGPTNRWAMFDQAIGSLSASTGSIVVTLDPLAAVNALALLDVTAASVRVQAAGYDRTQALAASPGMVTFLDLPATTGTITVTISGSGTVSAGTLLVGTLVGLGITESSPTAAITDYSRKETDDFGEVTLVERAWAKRMSVRGLIDTAAVDVVAGRIANVRATPALWIGDESLESVTVYGFFKDFSIEVEENVSALSLSVEGLSAAAKIAPLGNLVDWPDIADPDGTKPQDNATNGADPNSPFGDEGRTVGQAINDLDINAQQYFDLIQLFSVRDQVMLARTTLEGKQIGTVVVEVREVADSAVEQVSLLGATNAGKTVFHLNLDTVYVDATTSLSQRFTQLEAYTDNGISALSTSLSQAIANGDTALAQQINTVQGSVNGVSAQVSSLQDVVVGPGGAQARSLNSVNVNGHITGTINTNDGTTGAFNIVSDIFRLIDPNSGNPFTAFVYEDSVLRINGTVQAQSYKVGSVSTPAIADNAVSLPDMVVVEGGGASVGTDSDNIWRDFAPMGNVLDCPITIPAGADNASVHMDVHLTGRRTGGDNDNVSVRVRRADGSIIQPSEYTDILWESGGNQSYMFPFFDPDPPAGGTTYTVQTKNLDGNPIYQRGVLRPLRLAK